MALYESTNGGGWGDNFRWGTRNYVCTWYGVTCNRDGSVTRLLLHVNRLSGTIPPELGKLANLERLQLQGNNLTGTIPHELRMLTNHERLQLQGNNLTGTIPHELGKLSNLEWLDLRYNNFSGNIPSEVLRLCRKLRVTCYLD
jgi:hypothetical protein